MTYPIYILAPLLLGVSIFFAVLTRTIWGGRTVFAALNDKWTATTWAHFLMVASAIFSAFTGILALALTYKWLLLVVFQ